MIAGHEEEDGLGDLFLHILLRNCPQRVQKSWVSSGASMGLVFEGMVHSQLGVSVFKALHWQFCLLAVIHTYLFQFVCMHSHHVQLLTNYIVVLFLLG